jgi:hypothetical protein
MGSDAGPTIGAGPQIYAGFPAIALRSRPDGAHAKRWEVASMNATNPIHEFDTSNAPPAIEPIFIAAAVFIVAVLMIIALMLAAS